MTKSTTMPDVEQLISAIEEMNDTYIITSKYLENHIGKSLYPGGEKD